MEREEWTPWIGIQDIFAYLRKRLHWGVLVWALALVFIWASDELRVHTARRDMVLFSTLGGLGTGLALAWKLTERHQWTGVIPYTVATLGVLALLVPMTLVAHWIWPLESRHALRWVLGMSTLGVLLRGARSTAWMEPYWRGR